MAKEERKILKKKRKECATENKFQHTKHVCFASNKKKIVLQHRLWY